MENDLLKYRVWDYSRRRYAGDWFAITPDGRVYSLSLNEDGGVLMDEENDHYAIERCTGRRDMHQTPIYDGDVFADGSNIYVVRTKPGYGFCAYDVTSPYIIWGDGGLPEDTADPCFGVEVVGNVHDPVYKHWENKND